ncbi:MAG: S-layer homology domain-containing protein [Oscillospiraceae bacterium]|nr:S-layer homology domain-containing protein [Oscillospiraceae bacterium]
MRRRFFSILLALAILACPMSIAASAEGTPADRGQLTIDLTQGAIILKGETGNRAVLASLNAAAGTLLEKREGDPSRLDLDRDGTMDVDYFVEGIGSLTFELTGNFSVSGEHLLTLDQAAVRQVAANGDAEYYSSLLFRFPDVSGGEQDLEFPVFTDIPSGAYYYAATNWAVSHFITNGTSETTFSPDAPCTRGQVATFLWRAADCPGAGIQDPFVDVTEDAYYYDAVLWALEQGITNGTDGTHFSPNASCTRGQVVTFLYRASAAGASGGGSNPFTDVAAGSYYYDPVLWAVGQNITNGTDGTHFSPNAPCTRGQVVTFLYRTDAKG